MVAIMTPCNSVCTMVTQLVSVLVESGVCGAGCGGGGTELADIKAEVVQLKQDQAETKAEVIQMKQKQKQERDELDEVRQRGLKDNLVICSLPFGSKVGLIKSDADLQAEGLTLHGHVLDLIEATFKVRVPKSDVMACHRLKDANKVFLRLWNRAPGAPWWKLVTAIRTGVNKGTNLFINFQLTERRNQLSFHLRKLKKEKKIEKLATNENGQITFVLLGKTQKTRVTYSAERMGAPSKTLEIQDIDELVAGKET